MRSIEFRVQGHDSAKVAQELADQMKLRFGVSTTVRPSAPPLKPAAESEKVDPGHAVIVALELAVLAFHVYDTFIRQPAEKEREKLISRWTDIVLWAKSKLPTTIRALIGTDSLLLHETEPE